MTRSEERLGRFSPFRWIPRVDLLLALTIFLPLMALSFQGARRLSSDLLVAPRSRDILFDSDIKRVFSVETDRVGRHVRSSIHPLYSALSYPPVFILRRAGLSPVTASRVFHAAVAGLWGALFFLLLRRYAVRRFDAVLFTVLASSTASAFFFLPMVETFVLGSISMFPALALAAGDREKTSWGAHVASNIAAQGVTLTNGMAGLFASVFTMKGRRWVSAVGASLALLVVFSLAQKLIFPSARTPLEGSAEEAAWIFTPESGGPWAIFRSFFFHGITAPSFSFGVNWREPEWPLLSFQLAPLFSGSRAALAALPAWSALFALGLASLFTLKDKREGRLVLGMTLLFQLVLHLTYGRETFLYSMHFTPFLILIAAQATRSRFRPVALGLAGLVIAGNLVANPPAFRWAADYAGRLPTLRKAQERSGRRVTLWTTDPYQKWRFWHEFKR